MIPINIINSSRIVSHEHIIFYFLVKFCKKKSILTLDLALFDAMSLSSSGLFAKR